MTAHISLPRVAKIGAKAVEETGNVVAQLGFARPVLVTDKFMTSTGVAHRIIDRLTAAGLAPTMFDGVVPDPTTDSLDEGVKVIIEHGADAVIGLGGGSPMDSAKALAVLAPNEGRMREFKAPRSYAGPALPITFRSEKARLGCTGFRPTGCRIWACSSSLTRATSSRGWP